MGRLGGVLQRIPGPLLQVVLSAHPPIAAHRLRIEGRQGKTPTAGE